MFYTYRETTADSMMPSVQRKKTAMLVGFGNNCWMAISPMSHINIATAAHLRFLFSSRLVAFSTSLSQSGLVPSLSSRHIVLPESDHDYSLRALVEW